MSKDCIVYRCARQDQMYLYARLDLALEQLPLVLRQRMGALTEVMCLELSPELKLARVDAEQVRQSLVERGYYLQLPPGGHMQAHLYFGD